jgi:hypothetical protein
MHLLHFTHPLNSNTNGLQGNVDIDGTIKRELSIGPASKYEILEMSQSVYSENSHFIVVTTLLIKVSTK